MRQRVLTLGAVALTIAAAIASPAFADDGHDHQGAGTQGGGAAITTKAQGAPVFLGAVLSGAEEVPVSGGPAVGDRDGRGVAKVVVKGDRITFSLQWRGIGAPTLGHIHQGRSGTNGDVKVPLFTTAMPDTVTDAAGQVSVQDAALARQIRSDPAGFYVNLHSKEFPGGAVRGQLQQVRSRINPLDIIEGGSLRALADGDQEVPKDANSKVGDKDGHAIAFLRANGSNVGYSMAWVNITPPTLGHIHKGAFGKNGDVQLPLFTSPIPQNIFAISGTLAGQNRSVVQRIVSNPANYYANIHTAEFGDGAVRGQLFDGRGGQNNGGQDDDQQDDNGQDDNGGQDNGGGKGTPVRGSALLFDDPGTFSEDNATQGLSGEGCVNASRPGMASALQPNGPLKIWSGPDCTGQSLVVTDDIIDLGDVDFDNKITSVFFGTS